MATGRNRRGGEKGCIQLSTFIPSSPQFFEPMEILLYIYIYIISQISSPTSLLFSPSVPFILLSLIVGGSLSLLRPLVNRGFENFRLRLPRENSKGIVVSKLGNEGNDRERGKKKGKNDGREMVSWRELDGYCGVDAGKTDGLRISRRGSRVPDHLKNGWRDAGYPRHERRDSGKWRGFEVWLFDLEMGRATMP